LNDHDDTFIFHCIKQSLERVSIKNIQIQYDLGSFYSDGTPPDILQNLLVKFVRSNAPSLCWFRSDLTKENMNMLRLERPGIELLN